MTYYRQNGTQTNKPKEIWLNDKSTKETIEQELARQVNEGIIRNLYEMSIIIKFIENSAINEKKSIKLSENELNPEVLN